MRPVKQKPLRWHKCVVCGYQDLVFVGSKPWTCDLCLYRGRPK